MINSKLVLDGDGVPNIPVYESNETGSPLQRNGKFNNTITDKNGNFSIDIFKSNVMYLSILFNNKRLVYKANEVPKIIELNKVGGILLPEVEVSPKKKNYYWLLLLLLIPIFLKKRKK